MIILWSKIILAAAMLSAACAVDAADGAATKASTTAEGPDGASASSGRPPFCRRLTMNGYGKVVAATSLPPTMRGWASVDESRSSSAQKRIARRPSGLRPRSG